ncbi:MAG: fasciclin domain-containing protein, partial [Prevotella sp.]|nr:fasciclin domain-containing protein [Prevotella sp.]
MKTEKQYRNEKKKGMTRMLLWVAVFALMTSSFISCVDNDDDIPMNYYSSKKVTAAGFLTENIDQFSEFVGILKRTPYFSLLSTYGEYTLFAPNNEAISRYLKKMGYGSIDAIPTESCDTLARTHIIKKGAFFTTDISEGA